jgi:ArsR family metal-binding transcriptional regulator
MRFDIARICGVDSLSAVPKERLRVDLDRAFELLRSSGERAENMEVMIIIRKEGREMTLFRNGRVSIYPIESKEKANEIAKEVYSMIEPTIERR